MEDKKYIPMISDRKSTTLLEDPLPTLETAKKNCTITKQTHKSFNKSYNSIESKRFRSAVSYVSLICNITILLPIKQLN